MTEHVPPQAMSLFDLIGRKWQLEAGVEQVLFNHDSSSLIARLNDGRLAFVSTKDAESPDSRMRQEVDTGRMSLRPREKPLPPAVYGKDVTASADVPVTRFGEKGFAFSRPDEDALWRATARGQTLRVADTDSDEISALAILGDAARIVIARSDELELREVEGGSAPRRFELTHEVNVIAASADDAFLACSGAGQISVVETATGNIRLSVAAEGAIRSMMWSPCGEWIVAGCADSALLLCKVADGAVDRITQFPAAVEAVDFSTKANALLASGAFRIVGWTLPDLPFGEHEGTPIETGKPGLTVVDRLAVHQRRDICAACYSNGLVVACRAGQPDELMLYAGDGSAITSLVWSPDGNHLGWGDAHGNLCITTFPKEMFK